MECLRTFSDYMDYPLKHFFVGTGDLADKLEVTIKRARSGSADLWSPPRFLEQDHFLLKTPNQQITR